MASRIKAEAGRREIFGMYCERFGQYIHQINSRINVLASGYKFVGAKPLSIEDATKLAADTFSEGFVIFSGACVVIAEFLRSEAKSAKAKEAAALKEAELKQKLEERFSAIESSIAEIRIALRSPPPPPPLVASSPTAPTTSAKSPLFPSLASIFGFVASPSSAPTSHSNEGAGECTVPPTPLAGGPTGSRS